jgi:hypothetical protein
MDNGRALARFVLRKKVNQFWLVTNGENGKQLRNQLAERRERKYENALNAD